MSFDPQDCFESGVLSSCCQARIMLGDICAKCKEHCDADEDEESCRCDECGGEGWIEYNDAGPSYWGEDCPSEINHLITCRSCNGTGYIETRAQPEIPPKDL